MHYAKTCLYNTANPIMHLICRRYSIHPNTALMSKPRRGFLQQQRNTVRMRPAAEIKTRHEKEKESLQGSGCVCVMEMAECGGWGVHVKTEGSYIGIKTEK